MSNPEPQSFADPPSHAPAARAPSSAANYRRWILFLFLGVMLIALWYDRKVARPNVEAAYHQVERLNEDVNSRVGHKQVTNQDVQKALGTPPSRVYQEGGYTVEVYSWRAGLPIKTHDYYAVYNSASPPAFLKHYKFEVPAGELTGEGALATEMGAPVPQDKLPGPPTRSAN
jgi:hypothetical protein